MIRLSWFMSLSFLVVRIFFQSGFFCSNIGVLGCISFAREKGFGLFVYLGSCLGCPGSLVFVVDLLGISSVSISSLICLSLALTGSRWFNSLSLLY